MNFIAMCEESRNRCLMAGRDPLAWHWGLDARRLFVEWHNQQSHMSAVIDDSMMKSPFPYGSIPHWQGLPVFPMKSDATMGVALVSLRAS